MPALWRTLGCSGLILLLAGRGEGAASPPRLVPTLGTTAAVTAVAFSPEGRRAATGGREGEVILWDVATGGEIRRLAGHEEAVVYVRFFQGGLRLFTGAADGTARTWNTATGAQIDRFEAHMEMGHPERPEPEGRPFALSPDERWIVTWHALGKLQVRKSADGTLAREIPSPGGPPHFLAVSPDNSELLVSGESGIRLLDLGTGAQRWAVEDGGEPVAFEPETGRRVVTCRDGTLVLRNAVDGREIGTFEGHGAGISSLAWSPDGARLLSADHLGGVRLWEAEGGRLLARLEHAPLDLDVTFAPAGRQFLVGDRFGEAVIYEEDGRVDRRLQSAIARILWLGFAGGRPQVVAGDRRGTGYLWDPAGHSGVVRFAGHTGAIYSAVLSPDGKRVLTGGRESTASLWDAASGAEIRRLDRHEQSLVEVKLAERGALAMTFDSSMLFFWSTETGERRNLPSMQQGPREIDLAPDGKHVATRNILPDRIEALAAATGAIVWSRRLNATAFRFSPDGGVLFVALGLPEVKVLLLRTTDGSQVGEIPLPRFLEAHAMELSGDGRRVITAHEDRTARVWRREGELVRELVHSQAVDSVALSPDGKQALTSARGILHLWDVEGDGTAAHLLCRLVLFTDGSWLVVDPEGRFDARELDDARGVFWQLEDDPDPFRLLPPEVFLRDFYEPQLLRRLLGGEIPASVPPLATLDRAQPEIEIARIASSPGKPDAVDVTVRVRATGRTSAVDVHLLRDGRLVGLRTEEEGPLPLDAEGWAEVPFRGVALPRNGVQTGVTFGAYAFNGDGVKSPTVRKVHPLPTGRPARPGRAYLLLVGVNTSAVSRWNLRYAANDARLLQEILWQGLQDTKMYEEVVAVPLVADADTVRQEKGLPDRAVIRGVIDLLAGRPVAAEIEDLIPDKDRLRPAGPDDLVLLAFSTHGVTDPAGRFHLAPRDIGEGELEGWISSDDLSDWLRGVDAGSLVMIVDACHSAATISTPGFKPGPLGSRGLGQLAYAKGMQIVAASGVDDVALESSAIEQGFLTYALARSGLTSLRADWRPLDGSVSVSEWLAYGARRVPELHAEIRRGDRPADEIDRKIKIFGGGPPRGPWVQEPVVYDFAREGRDPLVLAPSYRALVGLVPRLRLTEDGEKAEIEAITTLPASAERLTRLYRFLDARPGGVPRPGPTWRSLTPSSFCGPTPGSSSPPPAPRCPTSAIRGRTWTSASVWSGTWQQLFSSAERSSTMPKPSCRKPCLGPREKTMRRTAGSSKSCSRGCNRNALRRHLPRRASDELAPCVSDLDHCDPQQPGAMPRRPGRGATALGGGGRAPRQRGRCRPGGRPLAGSRGKAA